MEIKELCNVIVECAKEVRSRLTPGYEEKIYKNAMFIELRERGITVETEVPFTVNYKNHLIGEYRADMIVDRRVIIELKAVNALAPIHSIQLVNYLTATGINDGMLINFGSEKLEIRHKDRLYHKPA
ncbi:MAG: GxxExxY protein [Prevotella sp.]|nr:GxxExxY protein [Prevotella sp.]